MSSSGSPCSAPCGWDTVEVLSHLCPFPPHSFYKANHIQRFSYSRPFKRGPSDPDNEFAVSAGRGCQDPQQGGTGELGGPCKELRLQRRDREPWDGEGGSPVPMEVGAPHATGQPWVTQSDGRRVGSDCCSSHRTCGLSGQPSGQPIPCPASCAGSLSPPLKR